MNPIISTRHFQKLIESIIELSFFIIIEHFPALGFSVWVNECLWGRKEVHDVAPCLLTSLSHSPRHPFTTPWQATHPSSASLCTWGPLVPLRGAGAWGPSALAVLMAPAVIWHLKTSNGQFAATGAHKLAASHVANEQKCCPWGKTSRSDGGQTRGPTLY